MQLYRPLMKDMKDKCIFETGIEPHFIAHPTRTLTLDNADRQHDFLTLNSTKQLLMNNITL